MLLVGKRKGLGCSLLAQRRLPCPPRDPQRQHGTGQIHSSALLNILKWGRLTATHPPTEGEEREHCLEPKVQGEPRWQLSPKDWRLRVGCLRTIRSLFGHDT